MPDNTSSGFRWIGRSVRRVEDGRFLRGRARYLDDISLPHTAHLVVVRSLVAHARLQRIDTEPARAMPGVIAVLTAEDLSGQVGSMPVNAPEGAWTAPCPHPLLAKEKVRYVGEPVAAVLAEDAGAAVDAAERISIDVDPLPAIVDPLTSSGSHTRLHEEAPGNVLMRWSRRAGNIDEAFARAQTVVRNTFHIPRLAPVPIEPRGAVALYDHGTDSLTLWVSSQDPYRPRTHLSRVLGKPEDRIRVIVPDVGGAFGSKGSLAPEAAIAAWLAMATGRPIKWVEQRRENFLAAYQGRGIEADVELAIDVGGRVTGLRARLVADLGAYLYPSTPIMSVTTAMLLTGTYAIPSAQVDLIGVATNKVPVGPYRGAGRPEAAYIIERMIDLAAYETGIDALELRRRNLISPDKFPYRTPLGFVYDSGNYLPALERVSAALDYAGWRGRQRTARAESRLMGVGIALYVERAGSQLWERAAVSVEPDGRVIVRTGSNPHGQGHETTFAQIAAEVLRVDIEDVTVQHGDTAVVPRGVGTFGSRSTTVGGSAVMAAAEKVKAKTITIAARLLEAGEGDIVWHDGALHVQGAPGRVLSFREVAAAAYQPGRLGREIEMGLEASAYFTLPGPVFPFGAYGAVVEIDRETGAVRVIRLVAIDDAGRIVNPLLSEGQVIGAAIQGLGQSLSEEVTYDVQGQPLTSTLADYALLHAADVPPIESVFLETISPFNPLGAKGLGEAGTIATPAAVANAVMDALAPLGIRHVDFPFTAPKIWRLLEHARPGRDRRPS